MGKWIEPLDLQFSTENCYIQILNLIKGKFDNIIPEHYHGKDCYEMHYIPNGYGILHIQKEEYQITPGTLYITGPQVHHEQIPMTTDPMLEYCLYLKVWSKQTASKKDRNLEEFEQIFISTSFWLGSDKNQVGALLEQLFWELEMRSIGYKKQLELITIQIMIALVRNYKGADQMLAPYRYMTELHKQSSVIIENYFLHEYAEASLEHLSQQLNIGKRQLQRILRECYGKTFRQKKTEARMSLAHQLLLGSSSTITEISDNLGFSTPEHFSKTFHSYYGISPREYRKNRGI